MVLCKSVANISGCLSFADSYSLHCKQSYALGQCPLFTGFACLESEFEGKSIALQLKPILLYFVCLKSHLYCGRVDIVLGHYWTSRRLKAVSNEPMPKAPSLSGALIA